MRNIKLPGTMVHTIPFTTISAQPRVHECERDLRTATVPVGYMFGSADPLMNDYYESNMYAWKVTRLPLHHP